MSFRDFAFTTLMLGALACGDDEAAEDGRGGGGGNEVAVVEGCDGAKLVASSEDTSVRGPWAVGARTLTIDGLTVEAWYPAAAGSAGTATARVYDVRAYLPPSEMGKIADADAPLQACDCYGDLPIDGAHGPYPVIVFVHGTAGFRTQSLELVTHWASRGFVVLAADHPGLYLRDLLGSVCGAGNVPSDLQADLDVLVGAIRTGAGLEILAPSIAGDRIGMIGHSAGGTAISARGDVAQVLVPMASGGVEAGALLRSSLILGAVEDQVVDYAKQTSGYEASPAPKRFVGLSPAGHLAFSSLCAIQNAAGQDIVAIGQANDVCGLSLAGALFDCDPAYVAPPVGWSVVNEATSAVLEETLHCSIGRAEWLSGIQSRHAEVAEYREQVSP